MKRRPYSGLSTRRRSRRCSRSAPTSEHTEHPFRPLRPFRSRFDCPSKRSDPHLSVGRMHRDRSSRTRPRATRTSVHLARNVGCGKDGFHPNGTHRADRVEAASEWLPPPTTRSGDSNALERPFRQPGRYLFPVPMAPFRRKVCYIRPVGTGSPGSMSNRRCLPCSRPRKLIIPPSPPAWLWRRRRPGRGTCRSGVRAGSRSCSASDPSASWPDTARGCGRRSAGRGGRRRGVRG
jgi:hypothetical protein